MTDDYEDEFSFDTKITDIDSKRLTQPNLIISDDEVDPIEETACDDEEVYLRCLSDEFVNVSIRSRFEIMPLDQTNKTVKLNFDFYRNTFRYETLNNRIRPPTIPIECILFIQMFRPLFLEIQK